MSAPAPELLIAQDWTDYAVLDSGDGWKLEQLGPYRFARPEPQALWPANKPPGLWQVDARFAPAEGGEDQGRWNRYREVPEVWEASWRELRFYARCTPFRHFGVFPEQSPHWRFAEDALRARTPGGEAPQVLNLFGYTGLASLVCARAGAKVTHVDASKKALLYAKQNQALAGLSDAPIRWICDDAMSFIQRELRRGRRYDGIILDPPRYGRGPEGEVWRLEEGLFQLLSGCFQLLRAEPKDPASADGFLIATAYAVRLSYLTLWRAAFAALESGHGVWRAGEMALPHAGDDRLLPTAMFVRWSGDAAEPVKRPAVSPDGRG